MKNTHDKQEISFEWHRSQYICLNCINDKYYFAGSNWNTQEAKRYILKNIRTNKIIESSYYLHLNADNKPYNVAFEPSTSFGCPVGCLFCASGDLATINPLNCDEISEQIIRLIQIFNNDYPEYKDLRRDVFYSGIGEPTLSTKTLIESSFEILKAHPDMQFKFSTMGAKPRSLIKWAKTSIPLRAIQIGVPHWDEIKIRQLYSKCTKYSLDLLLEHVSSFMQLRPLTKVKINYVVMKDFNDSIECINKTLDIVNRYLGNNIEIKVSCLNPTKFAQNNGIHAVEKNILSALLESVQHFNFNHLYLFGPMNKENLGCGQLAWDYQKDES